MSLNYVDLPKVDVKGVFEIGPVDFPYIRYKSDPIDVDWAVITPMCDQDVFGFDGRCPGDRVIKNAMQKGALPRGSTSIIGIAGTSHDVYNTQWQKTDISICDRQKPIQSQISGWDQTNRLHPVIFGESLPRNLATFFMSNFFAANILNRQKYAQTLDPTYSIDNLISNPSGLTYRVLREYVVGSKHSKQFLSFSLDKDATVTEGALILPFGSTKFTTSKQEDYDMCLSRTSIVQWNACTSRGPIENSCKHPRGRVNAISCKSTYYPSFDYNAGKLVFKPQLIMDQNPNL